MKKFTTTDGIALLVWLLPVIYICSIYQSLPASVPLHYGINGTPDRYGSPAEFVVFSSILSVISIGVYLLLKFLPAIDPKKAVKYGEGTYQKIALGLMVFLSALSIVITYTTSHSGQKIDHIIFPLISLFFVFLGNMMYNIKPNYFAGVRTPWTLESEDNWRATHRLAAKVWVIGGIAITIIVLFLQGKAAAFIFIGGTVLMALIPVIYSYIYFKKHPNEN